jgi:outer membrane lipoprotein SlyB
MVTVARDKLRTHSNGAGAMRRSALYAGLFVLVGMTGCAPTNQPAVRTQAPPTSVPGSAGTIVWMRSVAEPSGSEGWRTALLAVAAKTNAADGGEAAPLVEFIVRADDGAILSVVQGNDVGLRPGDRVVILYEGSTHLARPG